MDELTAELTLLCNGKASAAMQKSYCYSPLNGQYIIRLLELLPGEDEDSSQLLGRLFEVDIHDGIAYEAISYTWGDPIFDNSLQLPEGQLMITSNLASALKRFRSINSSCPRFLWVDQISINQADVHERSQQVSIMSKIYTNAERVFTWLGVGSEDTDIAIAMLKDIASAAESYGVREGIDAVVYYQDNPQKAAEADTALEEFVAATDLTKLQPFYSLPWFYRVWISQEVALPPHVIFFCGTQEIKYNILAIATSILCKIDDNPKFNTGARLSAMLRGPTDVIALRQIRIKQGKVRLSTPTRSSYLNGVTHITTNAEKEPKVSEERAWVSNWQDKKILDYVSSVGCTNFCFDGRDRVYAMINLNSDNDVEIKPDYGLSVEEVYADFSRKCLARQEVRILSHAGLTLNSMVSKFDSGAGSFQLPSWAPDWRVRHPFMFGRATRRVFKAGFGIDTLVRAEEQNPFIDIAGAFVDFIEVESGVSIQGLDKSRPPHFNFEQSRFSILSLKEFFDSHYNEKDYPTGETSLAAFARTVIADIAPNELAPLESLLKVLPNAQEMVNLWLLSEKLSFKEDGSFDLGQENVLPCSDLSQVYSTEETTLLMWFYMLSLAMVLRKRKLFITKNRYIGLAPAMSQAGDMIVLFGGCQTPFVLRPDEEGNMFRIVGECYLHGFMFGELLTEHPTLMFRVY